MINGPATVDFTSLNCWDLSIKTSKSKVLPSLFGEGPGEGLMADSFTLLYRYIATSLHDPGYWDLEFGVLFLSLENHFINHISARPMNKLILFLISMIICHLSTAQWEWQNPLPQGNDLNDVFFINENLGWAVGNCGAIVKSTDGGENWELLGPPTEWSLTSLQFTDSLTGFISSSGGKIFITLDGGEEWAVSFHSQGYNRTINDLFFISPDTGWAVSRAGKIYSTVNAGISWDTCQQGGAYYSNKIFFVDNQKGWIASGDPFNEWFYYGRILKTCDGGITWNTVYSNDSIAVTSLYFTDSLNGWATGCSYYWFGDNLGILLHTEDGGDSWTEIYYDQIHRFSDIWFCNSDTGWLACGFNRGPIRITIDGGFSWADQTSYDLWPVSALFGLDQDVLQAVGTGGHVMITGNGGEDWIEVTHGTRSSLYDITILDDQRGWAVGSSGRVLHTENGGAEWIDRSIAEGIYLKSAFFHDENLGFVAGQEKIFKTINSGESWYTVSDTNENDIEAIHFPHQSTGWAVGDEGLVLKTTDGGESWYVKDIGTQNYLVDVYFIDILHGWTISDDTVYRTTNGGVTWIPHSANAYGHMSIYFIDEMEGWLACWYSRIYHTTDGGQSWELQYSDWKAEKFPYTFGLTDIFFIDSLNGWAAGYGGSGIPPGGTHPILVHTSNGGEDWEHVDIFTDYSLLSVCFTDINNGWVCGGSGSILRTENGGLVWEDEYLQENNSTDIRLYPNPSTQSSVISYQLSVDCNVSLEVYDISGKIISKLMNEYQTVGEHKVRMDLSGFPAGIYLFRLVAGNQASTGKVVVR